MHPRHGWLGVEPYMAHITSLNSRQRKISALLLKTTKFLEKRAFKS